MNLTHNIWMKSLTTRSARGLAVKSKTARGQTRRQSGVTSRVESLENRCLFSTLNFLVNTLSPTSGSPTATTGGIVNAVNAVNADTTDTAVSITFSSSVFAGGAGVIQLAGLLDMNPTNHALVVSINATAVGGVTFRGTGVASASGAMEVDNGTVNLTDLTISDGKTNNSGGGLYNIATMTITNCTFTNDAAGEEGGGLDNENIMTVVNCTFTNDSANYGGGLYNDATMNMSGSSINNNSLTGVGGGAGFGDEGAASLVDCTITGNTGSAAGDVGGGLLNFYVLAMTDCTISNNSVAGNGGGIDDEGTTLSITSCTIGQNTGTTGGGVYSDAITAISSSTITGNIATGTGGGFSGSTASSVSINNSTFSGNSATGNGGGIFSLGTLSVINDTVTANTSAANGGGIAAPGTTVSIFASTVSGNSANGSGGGVDLGSHVQLIDTIVANSSHGGDLAGGAAISGSVNNLIDDAATGSGLTDGVSGNIVNHPAALAPLGSYGGPTQTIELYSASPALNAGTPLNLTTLTASVNSTATSISLPASSAVSVGLYVRIDSEIVLITGITNTTSVTIARAQLGTTAAAHSNGASLFLATDQRGTTRSAATPNIGAVDGLPTATNISLGTLPVTQWTAGQAYTSSIAISNSTGALSALTFTGLPAGLSAALSGTNIAITGTPTQTGVFTLHASVTDSTSAVATGTFTLTINAAPIITSAATKTLTVGQSGTFTVLTTGFPIGALSKIGALPAGVTFTDNMSGTATLAGTPAAATGGTYALTIIATNGISPDATQSFTLTVDQAPAITSAATKTFTVGLSGTFAVLTTGFPIGALSRTGALPTGITFTDNLNGTATLEGTPAAGTGGTYVLTISATNGISPAASQTFTLTIDQAPAITSAAGTTFAIGQTSSFTISSTGFPIGALNEAGALPAGVNFTDNQNGTATLAGTPTVGGVFNLTLGAANSISPNAAQAFTLTVDSAQAPIITSAPSNIFTIGQSDSFTIITAGFPTAALSETGALPAGVTFTDNQNGTATLAGTPTVGGVFQLTIVASNSISPNASQVFTLTVPQIPVTPVLTNLTVTAPASNVNLGATLQFIATGTDGTGSAIALGTVTWSLDAGSTGSIDQTGLFTAGSSAGSAIIRATSGGRTATLSIAVNGNVPVITVSAYAQLVSSSSNTGTLHVQGLQAGTDENLIYTWSIISQPAIVAGALDAGAGEQSAVPLAQFSINGTNSAKNTSATFLASGNYTLQVLASNGTQSVTSQVEVTATVKASATPATLLSTQVSGVQPISDGKSITGFVVTFNGPVDPTTAQNVLGYKVLRPYTIIDPRNFWQRLFSEHAKTHIGYAGYKLTTAVYDSQTDSVTLTLASPMPVSGGLRMVQVMGTGPHAVLDANGIAIDGDTNGKAGGNFTYGFSMSLARSVTYHTADGDTVKLSLTGPGKIAALIPTGTSSPVIDLINTDSSSSILTGKLRKGRNGLAYAVLDELNGTASADIQLGDEFHVNQNSGVAAV